MQPGEEGGLAIQVGHNSVKARVSKRIDCRAECASRRRALSCRPERFNRLFRRRVVRPMRLDGVEDSAERVGGEAGMSKIEPALWRDPVTSFLWREKRADDVEDVWDELLTDGLIQPDTQRAHVEHS